MPAIASPALDHLAPEQRAQELLNHWLKSYFTGLPHNAPGGPFTFPEVTLLFNAAVLPKGDPKPVIHGEFIEWPVREDWFRGSDLGTWEAVLATPASGVSYGRCNGTVIESVHGKKRRTLPGTDIRWQPSGGSLLEQTLQHGTWTTIRTIPNATALVWARNDGDYVERTAEGDEVRRITPAEALWDGALKTVSGRAVIAWYVIVFQAGGNARPEWLARSVAAQLESLFRDPQKTDGLQQKGMRHWTLMHNPRSLASSGAQVRYFTTRCDVRYFLPREHTT